MYLSFHLLYCTAEMEKGKVISDPAHSFLRIRRRLLVPAPSEACDGSCWRHPLEPRGFSRRQHIWKPEPAIPLTAAPGESVDPSRSLCVRPSGPSSAE